MPDLIFTGSMDGPYSPDQNREVAYGLAEAVRYLNHATHPGNDGGLEYPGDVYDLLGHLYTATGRLPQLFGQLAAFLKAQAESGRIADTAGRAPEIQAGMAADVLEDAAGRLAGVTAQLQRAQGDISGLYAKDDGDA